MNSARREGIMKLNQLIGVSCLHSNIHRTGRGKAVISGFIVNRKSLGDISENIA
jgi:hypothetical protein